MASFPAQAGDPLATELRETKTVTNRIGSEYWMPAFAGMATTDLKILGENR